MNMSEGRKEGRKEGRSEGRKEGRKEGSCDVTTITSHDMTSHLWLWDSPPNLDSTFSSVSVSLSLSFSFSDYGNSSCLSLANTIVYIVLDTCIVGLNTIASISGERHFISFLTVTCHLMSSLEMYLHVESGCPHHSKMLSYPILSYLISSHLIIRVDRDHQAVQRWSVQ